MIRNTIRCIAAAAALSGLTACASAPGTSVINSIPGIGVDPAVIAQIQTAATGICGFLPTVETVAGIITTFTGGGAAIGIGSQVADAICKAVTSKGARRGVRPSVRGVVIEGNFIRGRRR